MSDLQKIEHMLNEKNTYMHHFKNDTVKAVEKEELATKTNVLTTFTHV